MKKLLIFISVIFCFFSCNQDKYYNIPNDMKPLYGNNDTICFLDSANNRIDSFQIDLRQYYLGRENAYAEEIETHYLILNKHASVKGLYIEQGSMGAGLSIASHYFPRGIRIDENNDIVKSNVSIHGVIYPTVYVLHAYDFPDSIPNTVYYTFQHGIIRYDYSDQRKYEIMNR
jgi:hypothetical protein